MYPFGFKLFSWEFLLAGKMRCCNVFIDPGISGYCRTIMLWCQMNPVRALPTNICVCIGYSSMKMCIPLYLFSFLSKVFKCFWF
jgi:hypothetical protein